jgi:hypothetical protein
VYSRQNSIASHGNQRRVQIGTAASQAAAPVHALFWFHCDTPVQPKPISVSQLRTCATCLFPDVLFRTVEWPVAVRTSSDSMKRSRSGEASDLSDTVSQIPRISVWKRLWTCRETDKYYYYRTESFIVFTDSDRFSLRHEI